MQVALVLLFLIAGTGVPAAQTSQNPRYVNEEFGFSFEYPSPWGVVKDEPGSLPNDELHRVEFDRRGNDGWMGIPQMYVGVFRNPDGLELREFVYLMLQGAEREEIGISNIEVDGRDALRATYFAKAGPGCATSLVFIPLGENILVVNPRCSSQTVPQIIFSFVLDAPLAR